MGSATAEKGKNDEGPQKEVKISPFSIGTYEVTHDEFLLFMNDDSLTRNSDVDAVTRPTPQYIDFSLGMGKQGGFPVNSMSQHAALMYCRWLYQKTGTFYRLPTEAEWEYACRAGTRTRYPHGDDPQGLLHTANTFDQDVAPLWPRWQQHALAGSDGHVFTAPVGSYAPNAFGLHDMLGNAWEWVSDWHGDTYYAHSPRNDPQGPADGTVRVRRGGSWHTWSFYARCGYRNWNSPQTRYTLVGMRLVREISPQPLPRSRRTTER